MSVFSLDNNQIKKLVEKSRELKDLSGAIGLLSWDQETYMSPKGALSRARQLELLSGIFHDYATNKTLGKLLQELSDDIQATPERFTPEDKALVREMKRDFDLSTKIPKKLVKELSKQSSLGLEAWKHARSQSSFSIFEPNLKKIVELRREVAHHLGFEDSPYDALLDEFEAGLTKKQVLSIFADLKKELVNSIPMLVAKTAPHDKGILTQTFDGNKLWEFSMHVLTIIGFDLEAGRQDKSAHPFTMGLTSGDVRLTTRILENKPISTLLSTIHEAGHGMYEQGISPDIDSTTLGYANSLVIHESQSRFWENMIGKSKEFWEFLFPQFQSVFPRQLNGATVDSVWNELNVIKPSLIRVDADEVTYHMHIIIRTEVESALIEGTLAVHEAPQAWNAAYKEYLDVDVPDDAQGILQDIHWSQGMIGYFPTYSLGSLLSAQIYEAIEKDHLDMKDMVRKGKFEKPKKWLNEKIHKHGRMYSSRELAEKVTGNELSSEAYLKYIHTKFT